MIGSLCTIQDWEQGQRNPGSPAEALLRIAVQQMFEQIGQRLHPGHLVINLFCSF